MAQSKRHNEKLDPIFL